MPPKSQTDDYDPGPSYTLLDKTGYSSILYLHKPTNLVLKSFFPECRARHFPNEVAAYERLTSNSPSGNSHPNIPTYHGTSTSDPSHPGVLLERAENGNLYHYLHRHRPDRNSPKDALIWKQRFLKWSKQSASALQFAHSKGVFHSDIHCTNFILSSPSFDVKLGDWAGASIDGSQSPSFYRLTHRLFEPGEEDRKGMEITVRSEIFAFGSAVFNMVKGEDLWGKELDWRDDREEIVRRLREREMPETEELVCLGAVVEGCWRVEFGDMTKVVEAIEEEQRGLDADG